jgi:hypothetical protein
METQNTNFTASICIKKILTQERCKENIISDLTLKIPNLGDPDTSNDLQYVYHVDFL